MGADALVACDETKECCTRHIQMSSLIGLGGIIPLINCILNIILVY